MADKAEKPKKQKAKPKQDEQGVLAALPATRPERIGSRRAAAKPAAAKPKAAVKTTPAAAKPNAAAKPARTAAKASPAIAKPARAAKPKAAAKPARTARKPAAPRATATRRKAAAPRTFEPTQAAEAAAGAADERAARAAPLGETPARPRDAETTYPRPQAVREGAPGIGTTGYREQPSSGEHRRPGGVELVTTAVQAAGELAQIGLSIGGQILKRAVKRLPKP